MSKLDSQWVRVLGASISRYMVYSQATAQRNNVERGYYYHKPKP